MRKSWMLALLVTDEFIAKWTCWAWPGNSLGCNHPVRRPATDKPLPSSLAIIHLEQNTMAQRDLGFVIDVGTGSARCALVDNIGHIVAIRAREHEQIVPKYGWSEQRPSDWWKGARDTAQSLLAEYPGAIDRLYGIVVCGRMHGAVLLDESGVIWYAKACRCGTTSEPLIS